MFYKEYNGLTGEKMGKKRRYNSHKSLILRIVSLLVFVVFSFAAIKIGIVAGNFIFDMDSGFIHSLDTENFKITINRAIPLIEMVYDSGKVDASIGGELMNIVQLIFNFDLNMPLTILNAYSPYFSSYYHKHYLLQIAQHGEEGGHENKNYNVENNNTEEKEDEDEDNEEIKQGTGEDANQDQPNFIQDESSITYEEIEEKYIDKSNTVSSGKITIQNETKHKIDEAEIKRLLNAPLKFDFNKSKNKVLIYHTHTTEGYLKSLAELDKKDVPNRTNDTKYSVVRVGDELAQLLKKKYGIDVLHNGTVHDYPYNSSYSNSLKTLTQYLKSYPNIKLMFDIHRDGLGKGEPKLRAVKNVNGKNAAQIMFVVGTDGSGLKHPAWKENLKLAIKLQEKLNEKAPGLAKSIYISNNRYNHHISPGTLTIEIGGDGNLVSEALESVKYLAAAINDVINK